MVIELPRGVVGGMGFDEIDEDEEGILSVSLDQIIRKIPFCTIDNRINSIKSINRK